MLNEFVKHPVESQEHISKCEFPPLLFRKLEGRRSNHTSRPLWTTWIVVHYDELCLLPPKYCEICGAQWVKACECWNSACFQGQMKVWVMLESGRVRKDEKGPIGHSIPNFVTLSLLSVHFFDLMFWVSVTCWAHRHYALNRVEKPACRAVQDTGDLKTGLLFAFWKWLQGYCHNEYFIIDILIDNWNSR